jgi:uncharacterized membrane protein
MKPSAESLVFTHTSWSVAGAVALVLVTAFLGWFAWQRSGRRMAIGWLEVFRVLIVVCLAVTLNQPEWREIFKPDTKPVLGILWDASGSMETKDILDPAQPAAEPRSRADVAKPLVRSPAWDAVKQRMDLVVEPFSNTQSPPAEGTDINGALNRLMEKQSHLRAVVLVSDGDWNTGASPSQAATKLRMKDIPVFAVPVGEETRLPDVELVSFDVPAFGVAGKPLRIPFAIESSLPRDESVTLEMKSSNGEVATKEILLPAMGRLQDSVVWKPDKPGEVKLKLTVPKTGGERYLENNSLEAPLSIRKEQLKVLLVESFPRWEYRYLRNALQRDQGVMVNTLLYQPDLGKVGAGKGYLSAFPKDEELSKYDVIFLGDVGVEKAQLTPEQCVAMQKLVRDQAAGLVFLPGLRGYEGSLQTTPLAELLPVAWDDAQPRGWGSNTPGKFVLTEAGMHSLLTKLEDSEEANSSIWQTLPGFQWFAPALRAKAGTEVLAVHSSETNRYGRVPLIVTKPYGAGKILFMGADGAWRWRRGVEDRYHYRFWGQVVRWMAYQRNMASGERMRLFYSPDRPRTGDVLSLNVNVMSSTGEPLHEGAVIAQVSSPSGKTATVRLSSAGDEAWGLFTGTFTPMEPGEQKVHVSSAEAGTALDVTISVQGTSREKRGQPARVDVLRELAQLTRGKLLQTTDPQVIIKAITALPEPEPLERRIPLWAHPAWAGTLICMLGLFWAGRKAAGAF